MHALITGINRVAAHLAHIGCGRYTKATGSDGGACNMAIIYNLISN